MMQEMQVQPMQHLSHPKSNNVSSIVDTATFKSSTIRAMRVPKFLRNLYDILQYEDQSIISWSSDGTYFQIFDTMRLETMVLPNYFKHGKFASLQRQLNNFGFRKWTKTQASVCTFSHHYLVRCHPQQLTDFISRRPLTNCMRSGADASSNSRRKRALAELLPSADAENCNSSAYRNVLTMETDYDPQWLTNPMKNGEEYNLTGASSEQALNILVEELHDIILPSTDTFKQQDSSRSMDEIKLRTLNECVNLDMAVSLSNFEAGEHFQSIPFSCDSLFEPLVLTHSDE
ncbi:heat shock transcription factor [Plasmopara halstedii]|uniref:Heat shock transcription factor n=1 Tax=Plasmopara halstedii TaxID=4781 RepID=A0A0P1AU14_PLAHL|nr:heat shock transcription factor [Plasmopara halstedii]CEG44844.1 heat shock transcription factor [Plasmopara halstedii]|eukprot:XP_024581213.1 heat shock transcription factor [Plasmopara halstedii]